MESNFAIPQSPYIKDTVRSFWQVQRHNSPALNEIIIPKGAVELIFSFDSSKLQASINQKPLGVPRCFIQGFNTSPVQLHIIDKLSFFGVYLAPTAIRHILHTNPNVFVNCVTDLTLVDISFDTLWHRLGEQDSFEDRVKVFTDWLMKRLPQLTEREKSFNHFLNTHSDTHLSVSDIANHFCYSSKQLSRKLHELTGLNTEQTLLYKKYLQAVHLMHHSSLSLTDIAYGCHFSDQSHFIRIFKSLSLLTPKEYRNKKSHIEGHIFEYVH